jgi:pyruvate formate lyase activating enzyme
LHFSAFHPDWKMMETPRTPAATLTRARAIALEAGLHYVYTGNVHDKVGGSTYCPGCKGLLIERDWFRLGAWNLSRNGQCSTCGTAIAGAFEALPGDWGDKRMPVRLKSAAG